MSIYCVPSVPPETFIDDLEGEHGVLPDVVPDARGEVEEQVDEALALEAEPAEAFDADVEVGEFVLVAGDGELVLDEGDVVLGCRGVGGTQQGAGVRGVDGGGLEDRRAMDRDVRGDEEGEEFVLA